MSYSNGRLSDSPDARYEFDANGVLMKITEHDGRTHVKFIYDVHGLPNVQHLITYQKSIQAQASPAIKVEEVEMSLDDICRTPTSQTVHHSLERNDAFAELPTTLDVQRARQRRDSVSTQSSGPLGINHWTRHMPMFPRPLVLHPGSGAPTEVVQDTDGEPLDYNLSAPVDTVPIKPPSVLSGVSTEPAPSFGHAEADSGYFEYQEAGLRTFDCEDLGNSKRAQANLIIQRCDATERNLGVSKVPDYVRFSSVDVSSPDDGVRFVSPSPSGQFLPPLLPSRDVTPMPTVDESSKENAPPTPSFDVDKWRWMHDRDAILSKDLTTLMKSGTDSFIQEPIPGAEVTDPEMTNPTHKAETTTGIAGSSMDVFNLFARACSPLTEYDYSAMDAEKDSIKYRLRPRVKQLSISPAKEPLCSKPTSTRRRSKKHGSA